MTEIPVEGNVLRWARLYRGLTEKDAAKRLGISVTELSAYENNERKPTLGMFETFAAQYQLPQATLFRLTPPPLRPFPKEYRTIGGVAPTHSFEFNVALSNVRTLLAQLERIATDDSEFLPPKLLRLDKDDDPAE